MQIRCPRCNNQYDVTSETIDKMVECQCGNKFRAELVPDAKQQIPFTEAIKLTISASNSSTKDEKNSYGKPPIATTFQAIGALGSSAGILAFIIGIAALFGEDIHQDSTNLGVAFIVFGLVTFLTSAQFYAGAFIIEKVNIIAHNTSILVSSQK